MTRSELIAALSAEFAKLPPQDIDAAVREQSTAAEGVAGRVEQIAQMAEENCAAASNTAHSAQNLDRLATEMRRVVSAYRL